MPSIIQQHIGTMLGVCVSGVCVCVRACVCACVRACGRAGGRVCAAVFVSVCVYACVECVGVVGNNNVSSAGCSNSHISGARYGRRRTEVHHCASAGIRAAFLARICAVTIVTCM
jgi:hypothetical protein